MEVAENKYYYYIIPRTSTETTLKEVQYRKIQTIMENGFKMIKQNDKLNILENDYSCNRLS